MAAHKSPLLTAAAAFALAALLLAGCAPGRADSAPHASPSAGAAAETAAASDALTKADIESIEAGTPIDEVHARFGEPDGSLFGMWGEIYELDGNQRAVIYYDADGCVETVNLRIDEDWYGNLDGRRMTMDDVRDLAQKGGGLTFEAFKPFFGANASSTFGAYIMVYVVGNGYRLIVGSDDGERVDRADLESIWEPGGSGIDIREGDIDDFVSDVISRGVKAVSGDNYVPVLVCPSPLDTPLEDIKDTLSYLDIDPDADFLPFRVFSDGSELFGHYALYDAETLESVDFIEPSGLAPQTYILENAVPGRSYIVLLAIGDWTADGAEVVGDALVFGINIPAPERTT